MAPKSRTTATSARRQASVKGVQKVDALGARPSKKAEATHVAIGEALRACSGVLVCDAGLSIVDVSDQACSMLGVRAEDLLHKSIESWSQVNSLNAGRWAAVKKDAAHTGHATCEVSFVGPQGAVRWAHVALYTRGQLGFVAQLRDVTVEVDKRFDLEGQAAAINKSQATVTFSLDGTILAANNNFL